MPKTKVTPRAKHPDRTQQFLDATQAALEIFEDEISSFIDEVRSNVYRNYITAYQEALVPIWNVAHFANIRTILETVTDKKMYEIMTMAERLKPNSPHPKVIPEKGTIQDLPTITTAMLQKFPTEKLPDSSTSEKIVKVFSHLSTAHAEYSEAAKGLAELATLLKPQQYTLLLTATVTPAIQLIVPGQMMSPLHTPPPPKQESSTAAGRTEIMNFTKHKVLPNPDSTCLNDCDENSATRVLAAAIYCQIEKQYFDETRSRSDVATLFRCNTSQLSKAIMGVDYKSGPHHYKPKKAMKQCTETTDEPVESSKHKPTSTSFTQPETTQVTSVVQEDTLSSSSSSSDLPPGLLN